MIRNQSLAEQLAPLATPAKVVPLFPTLSRKEAREAAIAAVPVIRKPHSLGRLWPYWIDTRRQSVKSERPRTTWRRVKAATPALLVRDFDHYNEALEYSRSIGGHKPLRRIDGPSLQWRVVSPNLKPTAAEWVDAGPWHPPFRSYCDPSSIAETLESIPDFSEA